MTTTADAGASPEPKRHGWVRRVLPKVVAIAVVAAVFGFVLPRIASYGDVLDIVSGLSWTAIGVLALATLFNVATFAPPWMAALPGLGFSRALVMTMASTAAASVFPGGEAVGIGLTVGMLRAWGWGRATVAAVAAVLSGLNVLLKVVVFPAIAVGALLITGRQGGRLLPLTVIGIAAVAALLVGVGLAFRDDEAAARLGRLVDRLLTRLHRPPKRPFADLLVGFRREALELVGDRWKGILIWTVVGHLGVFLVLLASVRAVGVSSREVGLVDVFAAWSLTRLLTTIPITPGGVGIVELGLTGALVAAGGDNAEVVAAVLLYRALTWFPPIVLGTPSALLWRRLHPAAVETTPIG